MVSFILAATAVILNLIMIRFERNNKEGLAKNLNYVAILLFPSAYILAIVAIWLLY